MTGDVLAWWPGDDDIRLRAGQCYTLSAEMVLANIGLYGTRIHLVHGLLHPADSAVAVTWARDHPELPLPPDNPHAWVEIDGQTACDPVMRHAWTVEEHRRQFGSEVIRSYRSDVVVSIIRRRDSYGPWDRRSLDLWEARQQAARDDPRFSQQAAVDRFLAGQPR